MTTITQTPEPIGPIPRNLCVADGDGWLLLPAVVVAIVVIFFADFALQKYCNTEERFRKFKATVFLCLGVLALLKLVFFAIIIALCIK